MTSEFNTVGKKDQQASNSTVFFGLLQMNQNPFLIFEQPMAWHETPQVARAFALAGDLMDA